MDHPLSKQGFEQARSLADKLSALQAASGQTTQEQLQVATLQPCNPATMQLCNPAAPGAGAPGCNPTPPRCNPMYLKAQLVEQMSKAPTGREHGAAGGAISGEGAAARAAEAERRLGSGVQQVLLVVGQVK